MKTPYWTLILVSLLAVSLVPAASAAEVGVSGQCYDGPDDGGEGYFAVNENGIEHGGVANESFARGVYAYANDQLTQDPEPYCEEDDAGEPDEYSEVHVEAAGAFVQVCYAGQDAETGIHTTPECRTRPWSHDS